MCFLSEQLDGLTEIDLEFKAELLWRISPRQMPREMMRIEVALTETKVFPGRK